MENQIGIDDVNKVLIKEILKEYDKEKKLSQKDRRLHNTRLLMKNYNKLKNHLDDVQDELSLDCEDTEDEIWISSITRTKLRTMKMMAYIDSALNILEKNFRKQCQEYKYKAFELYYLKEMRNEQIQEKLGCGKNSPKIWSDEVTNELSILLWGIEALGI